MAFVSNSEIDFKEMLKTIGVGSFEELISNIPENLRFNGTFNIPEAESEFGILKIMESLAGTHSSYISFMGGGSYDHYIPSIVDAIISRSEFYTSYTPYQAEVSQGNLQAMYEFQSMICELTRMDVTNASMYESGSAVAEAVLLAAAHTGKSKVVIPSTFNCRYRKIIETYISNSSIELVELPEKALVSETAKLADLVSEDTAAVLVQHPNYYGYFEDVQAFAAACEGKKALLIQVYDPVSLGILKTPGEFGADIAIGEGQSLGNAQNFGGPYIGLFSASMELVRKIPGRLSGITVDQDGKRGFVLTLQTREQHIRREKATSNICTNSGLMAVAAAVYLSALGKNGIRQVASLCLQKSHYLADRIGEIPGVRLASAAPFFREFTVHLPFEAERLIQAGVREGILPGISLKKMGHPDMLLVAVTEKRTREELDAFADFLKQNV